MTSAASAAAPMEICDSSSTADAIAVSRYSKQVAYVQTFTVKWFQHVRGQSFVAFTQEHIDSLLPMFWFDFCQLDRAVIANICEILEKKAPFVFTSQEFAELIQTKLIYAVCRSWLKACGGTAWSAIKDQIYLKPPKEEKKAESKSNKPRSELSLRRKPKMSAKAAAPQPNWQEQLYDSDT